MVNVLDIGMSELVDTNGALDRSPERGSRADRGIARNPLSAAQVSKQSLHVMVGQGPRHRKRGPRDAREVARKPLSAVRVSKQSLHVMRDIVGQGPTHRGRGPRDPDKLFSDDSDEEGDNKDGDDKKRVISPKKIDKDKEMEDLFGSDYDSEEEEFQASGVFEYDYFSPTYTDATKEQNVNYFRSQADLEDFLKVSGTWKRIEDALRLEHELVVEEERGKALEKYHQRLEQQATRKRNIALYGQPVKEKTKKTKESLNKASDASPGQCLYNAEAEATSPEKNDEKKITQIKICANPKTAVSGEDRFESASALEIYLKTTALWEQIAEEVAHEKAAKRGHESPELSNSRSKLESPHLSLDSSQKMSSNGAPEEENVNAITNDIWANSHVTKRRFLSLQELKQKINHIEDERKNINRRAGASLKGIL
ncbi:uncharacterized protein PHALS_12854 [Plasmopara halstedii]|uniref:Uncharacterized protein n=1 Tax=Plasmopara halstedii TaxID=4781 RepID=A0A0P1AMX8_PLAHL|nr:uncharacterized protein PHALS_12854 [Plasmopara halstedii]CEG42592.1 hypothetical protein PHALS_12854 [Plasmopara halstedii]|eukprot:XP_024578961.1 hypothetical protein PHALS_12854 [Plasmopara halstedii]